MAKKKITDWGSLVAQLPAIIGKAAEYFDASPKTRVDKNTFSSNPRHIDQVYLEKFEKSLPQITSNFKKEDDMIRRKSYENDLQSAVADQGYKDRNTAISFETLYRMSVRDSVVSSIIVTRTNQISNFSRPEREKYSMGYKVKLKNHNQEMTEDDIAKCTKLEEWILNCGFSEDRVATEKMNFEEFIRRIIPDRLTYDAVCIELIPCADGSLHHFLPVSSGTIRFATNRFSSFNNLRVTPDVFGEEYYPRPDELVTDPEEYRYLQLYRGLVIEGFSEDEMIYRQGNPTNEPSCNGYSIPELERLVGIVASHLYAETHNKMFFTGGFTAQGILHFKGDIPQEQMDGFRRAWETQVTGANNSFRTPIIATEEEVTWLPISMSNKDMEWQNWINYLIKITCAIFQIDPSEIGFWDLSQGTGSTLNEGNKNEQILKQSRDKGLRPMLRFVESIINEEIFPRLGDDIAEQFEFRFVGLEDEERRDEVDRHAIEVKTKKTVNQVRRESGLPPLPNMDNIILDGVYLDWWKNYSPEAVELKIKNLFLEKVLIKKYEDKLQSIFPDHPSLMAPENNQEQDQPEEEMARSRKGNDLVKVEYFNIR